MSEKLERCPFCGGEAYHDSASCWNHDEEKWMPNFWHRVICKNCGNQTKSFYTEAEAIEAWNRRTEPERTAKVRKHEYCNLECAGEKIIRHEYLCSACKRKVLSGDCYCSHCGVRLDWKNDE